MKLSEFLEQNSISQSAIARAIGVSAGAISQYLKGVYKGDNKALNAKIEQYIASYENKKANAKRVPLKKSKIFASTDYKMSNFIISEAINEREIAVIYGSAGTGKSTVLCEFANKNPNAVLVEVTPHVSAGVLLDDLCEALKIDTPKGINARLKAVAKFLKNTDKVVLIDEAEHLPLRALEDLRRIYDFSGAPIILCGTEILIKNLMGKNKELRQLYSRVCGKWCMQCLSKKECDECFGGGIYEFTRGNFRSSAKLYKKAARLAGLNGCEMNEDVIRQAVSMVIL